MTQGDRVKKIRKDNNMTLEEFGAIIGLKKSSLSQLEHKETETGISTAVCTLICKNFNVSSDWLMFGVGDPYRKLSIKEELAEFFADVLNEDDDSIKVQFIETIAQFGPDEWKLLAAFAEKFIKKNKG